MDESLVELVERDIKEVVEQELGRLLEHYKGCELVDGVTISEDMFAVKYDVIMHDLPCDVYRNLVVSCTGLYEITETRCHVEFHDQKKEKNLGYVNVVKAGDRCFVVETIFYHDIYEIAKKIVEEAEKEE
jgi:hypothetical protein